MTPEELTRLRLVSNNERDLELGIDFLRGSNMHGLSALLLRLTELSNDGDSIDQAVAKLAHYGLSVLTLEILNREK